MRPSAVPLLAVFVVACRSSGGGDPGPSALPAASTTATSASAASARPIRTKVGTGVFLGDLLAACVDHDVTFITQADADAFAASVKGDGKDGSTFFPNGCAATVQRHALATCTEDAKNKDGKPIGTLVSSYFIVEALGGDGQMRKCVADGGTWSEVARDSDDYERADLEARQRKNERRLKDLEKK